MVRRIFLALRLDEPAKEELLRVQKRFEGLPARWTKKENLHITLLFLGNASEQELEATARTTREVAARHKPFSFALSRIEPGPAPEELKMVWATGEAPKELLLLKEDLEKALAATPGLPFVLHVTLAKINEWELRKMDEDERPEITGDLSLKVEVSSLEIMESRLSRGRTEYSVVESVPLYP
ncbi:MAG: RNA 2',3'-cyclic phosphodiesterase [bacterium]|nr:RNA 2',3'-cyclic phosphodiesterase [bacterium]